MLTPAYSETINIGADGSRVTPGRPAGATRFLPLFGGPSMLGTGVDDAHAAKRMAEIINH